MEEMKFSFREDFAPRSVLVEYAELELNVVYIKLEFRST